MNELNVIAHIHNDFTDKFGIPRQSGILDKMESKIVFVNEFRQKEALRGLEDFSHLWLIWGFSKNEKNNWSACVRPPRLGGNKRMGVFATRSPFRPNPIGLSSVKLIKIEENEKEGPCLIVGGADMLSGTPIYDIKPYIKYTDCHEDAISGFADEVIEYKLTVKEDMLEKIDENNRELIRIILENDPRPSYQNDETRVYGLTFSEYNIKFTVKDNVLSITDVAKKQK